MGVGTIGMFFCLPETKGRAAAELDEMFEAKIPARKFKGTMVIGLLPFSSYVN
jgi:hypothetical protein